jgi:chemotaxis protein methyltransferase CheR
VRVPIGPPPIEDTGTWVDAIGKAADRIRDLTAAPASARPGAAAVSAPAGRRSWDLASPLELLRQERYGEALDLVQVLPHEAARDPDVRLLEAVLLAHSGQLGRAEQACRDVLQLDELNAGAHYVLALCCEGSGDGRGAVEHDRIATYLDPGFAMPRLHLGLLARRAGEHTDARRELAQALDLLQREDSSRLLFFGGGFGREALVALCRAELVVCGGGR